MKVFGSKKYKILDSKHTEGLSFEKTDKTKFIIDVDIMQGSVLKVTIPAGGVIVSRNQDYTIHKESNTKTELFIGIDEGLDSIEFPEGAEVYMQVTSSGGSDNGSGGGSAEIPTCTVRFVVGGNGGTYQGNYHYTKCENGVISFESVTYSDYEYDFDYTFENVVCGSVIFFDWSYSEDDGRATINGTAEQIADGYDIAYSKLFKAPLTADEVCTIEVGNFVIDSDWWG